MINLDIKIIMALYIINLIQEEEKMLPDRQFTHKIENQ